MVNDRNRLNTIAEGRGKTKQTLLFVFVPAAIMIHKYYYTIITQLNIRLPILSVLLLFSIKLNVISIICRNELNYI